MLVVTVRAGLHDGVIRGEGFELIPIRKGDHFQIAGFASNFFNASASACVLGRLD
jgi:hypothetical protein